MCVVYHAQSVVLSFSTKRLRTYLLAWQEQAHMLAGASHLLRRLLAVTLRGAFQEWLTVAQERAHWRRVSMRPGCSSGNALTP
jgi:hypothetical protein